MKKFLETLESLTCFWYSTGYEIRSGSGGFSPLIMAANELLGSVNTKNYFTNKDYIKAGALLGFSKDESTLIASVEDGTCEINEKTKEIRRQIEGITIERCKDSTTWENWRATQWEERRKGLQAK